MDAAYFAEVHGRGLSAYYFSDKAALRQLYSGCYADTVLRYAWNTIVITALCVVGTVISSAMVAYSMSKVRWNGKKYLFPIIVATMMIPYQVTLIPLYMIWNKLGLIGSIAPLVVPAFFGGAYYIFLLRQFFKSIPDSLLEAAEIDGAGEVRIFAQIMLPLCKPAMASVAIFTFINTWSDFMGPMLYLNRQESYTLSIGLQAFLRSTMCSGAF